MINQVPWTELAMAASAVGLAFSKSVRYELLKRDKWTCQGEDCLGNYIGYGMCDWRGGWNLNAAHYPDLHQKEEDKNMEHGRCLCVHCHIVEEIQRGNHGGAGLLYERQTIRNKEWLGSHGWVDQKMPITWYYDWADSDESGREGLAMAFLERFSQGTE